MKSWFDYRYTWAATSHSNPFRQMLKALRKPMGTHPGQTSVTQGYLSANVDAVNEIYRERIKTAPRGGIALRMVIAKELLDAESEETREWWKDKVEDDYEAAMNRYEASKSCDPSDQPEDRQE